MDKTFDLSEEDKRVISLESEIRNFVREDNGVEVSFMYNLEEGVLDIVTHNPRHGTFFLLDRVIYHEGKGNRVAILTKALDSVKQKIKPKFVLIYELTWSHKGESHVSHFSGCSLLEICEKFYYKNNPHDFIIQKVTLRPEA